MSKQLLKQIDEYTELYRDRKTGIAWVEDGHGGIGHSCHPNIDESGSVVGMVNLRHWSAGDRTAKSHGFIYNLDRFIVTDELDKVAADACCCVACAERRAGSNA